MRQLGLCNEPILARKRRVVRHHNDPRSRRRALHCVALRDNTGIHWLGTEFLGVIHHPKRQGTLQIFPGSFKPQTDSPVWIATVITDTNTLNIVSFDAEFTSAAGADGLLSVYWDTNMIGLLHESAVQPGFQHYNLSFPNAAPNTSHVLGFHLDPFSSVQSSMILTNIVTGCVGVSQPFSLSITANTGNGLPVYQLTGQPANYTVQASTDLLNWTNIAILANTTGTVSFTDPNSTNRACCFYRVVAH